MANKASCVVVVVVVVAVVVHGLAQIWLPTWIRLTYLSRPFKQEIYLLVINEVFICKLI